MKGPYPVELYLGLVHGPVQNKRGEEVTTSVTNLDIHDIARSAKTFGVQRYFIITSIRAQHALLARILGHWGGEVAGIYNPDRQEALSTVCAIDTLAQGVELIEKETGRPPLVVVTGANFKQDQGGPGELWSLAKSLGRPIFLLFGTGWGLSPKLTEAADFRLRPIYGQSQDGYNHLSVRSAVAIYLDRLSSTFNL